MANIVINDNASAANAALASAPVTLKASQQSLYIDLMDQYVAQVMPSMSGRVFGQIVGLIGAFMASKVALVLSAAPVAGWLKAPKVAVMSGERVIGFTQLISPRGAGAFAKLISGLEARFGGEMLAKLTKGTASNLAFWTTLGLTEDVVKDYDYLMAVWRRQIRPNASFLKKAPQYAAALAEFVGHLEAEVWDAETSEFNDYIRASEAAGTLVPFTISREQLVYAYLWLDGVQRYLRAENTPKGTPNPHIYSLQIWVAALIIQFEKNGIGEELVFSPSYPVYTWTGIPKKVADALTELYANAAQVRDAYEELGFADSETFQSVGTTFIQVCTKAGLQALQSTMPGGVLSWLASRGIVGSVKKASPYILRLGDLTN